MTAQHSFTKLEKAYNHTFRDRINRARTTNEVYDVFCHTMAAMFNEISEGNQFRESDIDFYPERSCHYELGDKLRRDNLISARLNDSDLGRILDGFARTATNRHNHLDKHPEKTNSKIMRH